MKVNRKCMACGFVDKYQHKIRNCPKCNEMYKEGVVRSKEEIRGMNYEM